MEKKKRNEVPEEIKERVRQVIKDAGYDSIERDISPEEMTEDVENINPDVNTLDRG